MGSPFPNLPNGPTSWSANRSSEVNRGRHLSTLGSGIEQHSLSRHLAGKMFQSQEFAALAQRRSPEERAKIFSLHLSSSHFHLFQTLLFKAAGCLRGPDGILSEEWYPIGAWQAVLSACMGSTGDAEQVCAIGWDGRRPQHPTLNRSASELSFS